MRWEWGVTFVRGLDMSRNGMEERDGVKDWGWGWCVGRDGVEDGG